MMDKRLIAAGVSVAGAISLVLYSKGMWAGLLVIGMVMAFLGVGLATRLTLDGQSPKVVTIAAAISTLLILGVVGAVEMFHFTIEPLMRQYGNVGAVLGGAACGALYGIWWGCAKAWLDYRNERAAAAGA